MARRSLSIRTCLLLLIAALLLPAVVFSALLLRSVRDSGIRQYQQDAQELSRRLSQRTDLEILAARHALQTLAASKLFAERRLRELHEHASEVKAIIGSEIIIKTADGQQVVNTREPWGARLPVSLPAADRAALASKQPTVSDLFVGATAKRQIVSINVPILSGDQAIGLINTGVEPLRLSRMLVDARVPEGWTAAIVDRNGKILARTRDPERFIGTTATEDLRRATTGNEGTWTGSTADGTAVFAAYTRSSATGWITAVGVPKAIIEAPLWRSLTLLALAALVALAVSLLAANWLARLLTQSTAALASAAAPLGRGEAFVAPALRIAELQSLSSVLASASHELQDLKAGLEAQVAARTHEVVRTHQELLSQVKQRELVEDQLRQSQKMEAIGQLTGGLAHDFNNLLTIISGSLQLLQKRLDRGQTGALQRYLDSASAGVAKASTLTHRLLAFGRKQALSPQVIEPNELVKSMSDLLRRSLGDAITIEPVLGGGLWRVHADRNQLENAILNLALNARDAMPDGGKLTIETANCELDERYALENPGAAAGQFVLIAITDTGAGMTAETAQRAFEPFFTTKPVGQGTGLGLSQVYGFLRQSGGHAKIYSELGVGTSVKIYLPRSFGAAGVEPVSAPESGTAPAAFRPCTVLAVEDDPEVRMTTVGFLNELGYTTLEAGSGAEALRILDAHPEIELLFTDVVMPEMNGRRLADEARKRKPALKVLFTTGYTRNAVVHGGIVDPDVVLISKPFSLEQLRSKIEALLREDEDRSRSSVP